MQDIERAFILGWTLFRDLADQSPTSIFEPESRVALKATLKSLGIDFDVARLEKMKQLPPQEKAPLVMPLKRQIGVQIDADKGPQAANAFTTGFDLGLLAVVHENILHGLAEPVNEVKPNLLQEGDAAGIPSKMLEPLLFSLDDTKVDSNDYNGRVIDTVNTIQNHLFSQSRGGRSIFIAMSYDPELVDVAEAIETAIKNCQYNPWRADEFAYVGTAISDMIYDGLRKADYVVVDLTGARPNVYFEAGYAHALGKVPFYIAKKDVKIEFDVSGYPVLYYTSMKQLREDLAQRIQARANAGRAVAAG